MNQSLAGPGTSPPQVWGPASSSRVLLWMVLTVSCAGTVLLVLWGLVIRPPDGDRGGSLAMAGMPAMCALATWRFGLYPQVTASAEGVTVRNPLGTRRLVWSEIREVRPGYSGLEIQRADGGVTTACAVQQANVSAWLGRRTRANDVAEELTRLSEQLGAR